MNSKTLEKYYIPFENVKRRVRFRMDDGPRKYCVVRCLLVNINSFYNKLPNI